MRSVDTRFWADTWVRRLSPLERYVFLYFLTNHHSNWCGVYEVDIETIAHETSMSEATLRDVIKGLRPKVLYVDGWVCITNFVKYHTNSSPNVQKGLVAAWNTVPDKIKKKIRLSKLKFDGLPTVAPSASASAFASTSSSSSAGEDTPLKEARQNTKTHKGLVSLQDRAKSLRENL